MTRARPAPVKRMPWWRAVLAMLGWCALILVVCPIIVVLAAYAVYGLSMAILG